MRINPEDVLLYYLLSSSLGSCRRTCSGKPLPCASDSVVFPVNHFCPTSFCDNRQIVVGASRIGGRGRFEDYNRMYRETVAQSRISSPSRSDNDT